jgi:hypothetical protein
VVLSRSITAYYDPIRQSRRHPGTSRGHRVYPGPSLCGSAEATRETFPTFPGVLSARAADLTPVGPLVPPVRLGRSDTRLPRMPSESPPTAPSLPAMLDGGPFRGGIVRVMLRPVRLPGPPGWLRRSVLPRLLRDPCHSRFGHGPSPSSAGSQARWANGKSPIVGTCARLVTTGSAAAP